MALLDTLLGAAADPLRSLLGATGQSDVGKAILSEGLSRETSGLGTEAKFVADLLRRGTFTGPEGFGGAGGGGPAPPTAPMPEGPDLEKALFTPPKDDPLAGEYNAYRQSVPGNTDPMPFADWKKLSPERRPQAPPAPGSTPVSGADLAKLLSGGEASAMAQLSAMLGKPDTKLEAGLPKSLADVYSKGQAGMQKAFQGIADAQKAMPQVQALSALLRASQLPRSALLQAQATPTSLLTPVTGTTKGIGS
jgi:hypothetical protein